MPKKSKPRERKKIRYNQAPPPPTPHSALATPHSTDPLLRAAPVPAANFVLHDDGTIQPVPQPATFNLQPATSSPPTSIVHPRPKSATPLPLPKGEGRGEGEQGVLQPTAPKLVFRNEERGIFLYHGNSLDLLDTIAAKYPDGRFDMIFADPPYFLSNGGITCHAGKMVKVDKGDWDKSRGPELNHEFNLEWLRRCQRVLKPNGTIWVSGTHHVIFSIGYALQQLGFKILNDIAWEKPNPPPNLSCRYFTHSTETVLWAAKNEKSKHVFNYAEMKAVTGKQMKTVWSILPPSNGEKSFGKHPTQKPVALIERCLLASTNENDLVLDPFLGGGTTAIACIRLERHFVGIEMDLAHLDLAAKRSDRETVLIWLREFRVRLDVAIFSQKDLDPEWRSMDRINELKESEPKTDCIFHETKFVFLSCAVVSSASVVHTTLDVSLQEAWAKTPNGKKRETTHIVRCQTEILRVKN